MGDKWEGWEYEKGGQSEGVNLGFKPAGGSVHQRVHLERVFFRVLFFFFLKYLPQGRNSFGRVVRRRRVDHHRHHTKNSF